jgi:hypothetical protein
VNRSQFTQKVGSSGLVRMETPVLYFYAQHPVTASVEVRFPKGYITEWYPNPPTTSSNDPSVIRWDNVRVTPGEDLKYPGTEGASHYYAARNTDSAPLRIGDQQEKMIFYRGLGNFTPPLQASYTTEGKLKIANIGPEPIPLVIAFESDHGRVGYQIADNLTGSIAMDPPPLTRDVAPLREELVQRLTGLGLYPKEARAMVQTWSDSWFNDGARVFYIVPRATVDSLLPITIQPAPQNLQRVFVGRVEVLSPGTRQAIEHAVRSGDGETLTALGRYLQPFVAQMQRTDSKFKLTAEAQKFIRAIATGQTVAESGYGAEPPASQRCVE